MNRTPHSEASATDASEDDAAAEAFLERRLALLLETTLAQMLAAERRVDPMFGAFGPLVALSHLAYGHEARLLEEAISVLCEAQPHLRVVQLDRPIPLVPAAREALRSNEWENIEGIRLPSRVYAEDGYAPDLVVVHRRNHEAFLFDIKRSVDNKASRVRNLREKLKAAALVAPDWLSARARIHMVSFTRIAILDASGETDDAKSGILTPSGFERVLDIPGFAVRLAALRQDFAARLRDELERLAREQGWALAKAEATPTADAAADADVNRSAMAGAGADGETKTWTVNGEGGGGEESVGSSSVARDAVVACSVEHGSFGEPHGPIVGAHGTDAPAGTAGTAAAADFTHPPEATRPARGAEDTRAEPPGAHRDRHRPTANTSSPQQQAQRPGSAELPHAATSTVPDPLRCRRVGFAIPRGDPDVEDEPERHAGRRWH